MCTLSWTTEGATLEVLFNRDEKHTRAAEIAPHRDTTRGVAFIAPRDPEGGGSWIGVNEYGLVVALLNGYREKDREGGEFRSRGEIVIDLLGERDARRAMSRLEAIGPDKHRSFVLAVFEAKRGSSGPQVVEWDRTSLVTRSPASVKPPILSSSFEARAVGEKRRAVFDALHRPLAIDSLVAAHASHVPGKSAYSVCMHREDAKTRSFTRIRVDDSYARLTWHGAAPCESSSDSIVELSLAPVVEGRTS